MFAIVEASGRQYQVEAGKFIDFDLQSAKEGEKIVFDRILMIVDGSKSVFGKPTVAGAKVIGHVLDHGKDKKIIVYKQRPKKGTRKKQGHRQMYTRVLIDSIMVDDKVLAEGSKEKKKSASKAKEEK